MESLTRDQIVHYLDSNQLIKLNSTVSRRVVLV